MEGGAAGAEYLSIETSQVHASRMAVKSTMEHALPMVVDGPNVQHATGEGSELWHSYGMK